MLPDRLSVLSAREALLVPPGASAPSPHGVNGVKPPQCPPATPGAEQRHATESPPSPHGVNGDSSHAAAGRGPDGRFAKGNPGAPGNPFARQVAALRQEALAAVTPADVRAILAKMVELALAGNVPAAKLVLAYSVGKPAPTPEPDKLDIQEWRGFKETAPMLLEAESLLTPNPDVLLGSVRAGRYARTRQYCDMLTQVLDAPLDQVPAVLRGFQRRGKKGHKKGR
jgi:hypothetical protein